MFTPYCVFPLTVSSQIPGSNWCDPQSRPADMRTPGLGPQTHPDSVRTVVSGPLGGSLQVRTVVSGPSGLTPGRHNGHADTGQWTPFIGPRLASDTVRRISCFKNKKKSRVKYFLNKKTGLFSVFKKFLNNKILVPWNILFFSKKKLNY